MRCLLASCQVGLCQCRTAFWDSPIVQFDSHRLSLARDLKMTNKTLSLFAIRETKPATVLLSCESRQRFNDKTFYFSYSFKLEAN